MGKHKKQKKQKNDYRDYNDYQESKGLSGLGNFDINSIASILGNIDIGKLSALLGGLGGLNNQSGDNSVNTEELYEQSKILADKLKDVDINKLIKDTNTYDDDTINVNNEEMNKEYNYQDNEYEDRVVKQKTKKKKHSIKNYDEDSDSVVKLLGAIKSMVNDEKAEILEKIIQTYTKRNI
ncbi:hypothetical protein OW763_08870 [Clostridium aestuarii]|uniref:Uncharacterized protein n=1 Tax=Clostridium aestuarii TaxID=338193 RepID=A0ABT4CZP0_9CLOT|nr:hypothetical protein [Clostridium aestuarii]MCY6484449.1 hypothetical protein [Clostridium aestuarii]